MVKIINMLNYNLPSTCFTADLLSFRGHCSTERCCQAFLVNATIHFPWGESGVTEHLAIQDLPRMMPVCSADSLEDLIGQVKLSISADEKRFGIPLTWLEFVNVHHFDEFYHTHVGMEIKLSSFWNSAQYHHGLVEYDSRSILPVAGRYVVYQPAYLDLCILCYVERCRPASRYDYSKPHG